MTGEKAILAMRRAGRKPGFVWVSDFRDAFTGDGLTVGVHGDNPEALDLRFLVGCVAIVEGPDAARVERITKACREAKAARVIASTHGRDAQGFGEVVRVTDTQGVMTWPE